MSIRLSTAVLLVVAQVGCGQSRLTTAVKPAGESSVQPPSLTDTVEVEAVAPVPPPARPTAPIKVQQFDTVATGAGRVARVTVRDEHVEMVRPDGRVLTYAAPTLGETLDLDVDSAEVSAQVRGTPARDTVKVQVPEKEDEGLLATVRTYLAWTGALVLVGGALYLARNLFPSILF